MTMDIAASQMEQTRNAELEAGRARFMERKALHGRDVHHLIKEADEARKEDEARREILYTNAPRDDQATRDRAMAEVVDQAQTELEALGHETDRVEKIVTIAQQLAMETQEGPVEPVVATELTVDHVTMQAVNQPTILANEAGQETEKQALNTSGLPDELLVRQDIPEDKHVPKTRAKAEKVAKGKVPPAERMLQQEPEHAPEAVSAVEKASDDILSLTP